MSRSWSPRVQSSLVLVPHELWWPGGVQLSLDVSLLLQAGEGHSTATYSLRVLASLTARENVVSGARSHPHNPHGVENPPSQWSASAFMYCLTPVERTFWVQIPPGFSLHVLFSSYKSTQELGSLKRRVLAVPWAVSLLWPASQDVVWVVGITQGQFSPLQDWLLWHFVDHCIRNYWCKSNLHSALCLIKAFLTGTLCVWHEYGWLGLHEPEKSLFI